MTAAEDVDYCKLCGLSDRHDANCAVFFEGVNGDREAVHEWFELSYSNFLVLPRSLMQSMPGVWQSQMVALLEEIRIAYDHLEHPDYKVETGEWCYLSDLSDDTLNALGIKSSCSALPVGEREHDPSECDGGCYYDADGEQVNGHTASVFVPGKDPIPHYNRGRTHVARADELASAGEAAKA